MSDAHRAGNYRDHEGEWRPDRRKGDPDRRGHSEPTAEHERRKEFRRRIDREIYEPEHKAAIKEALDDFAQEHGGQV